MNTMTSQDTDAMDLPSKARESAAGLSVTPFAVDRSAWISWICYCFGLAAGASPSTVSELTSGGPTLLVLAGSVAAFFAALIAIQLHMRLSPAATSFGSPKRLVTTGVFRFTRNPIYLAFLLPLASLAWLSPPAALLATALYIVAMNRLVIAREEQVLGTLFGAEYESYRTTTPRWL